MICPITGFDVKEKEMTNANDLPTVSRDEMEAAYFRQKDVGSITDFCSDYFNRKLSDWAAKCQKVYKVKGSGLCPGNEYREDRHDSSHATHTALLFNVKPIEQDRVSDSEIDLVERFFSHAISNDVRFEKAKDIIRRLKLERGGK